MTDPAVRVTRRRTHIQDSGEPAGDDLPSPRTGRASQPQPRL